MLHTQQLERSIKRQRVHLFCGFCCVSHFHPSLINAYVQSINLTVKTRPRMCIHYVMCTITLVYNDSAPCGIKYASNTHTLKISTVLMQSQQSSRNSKPKSSCMDHELVFNMPLIYVGTSDVAGSLSTCVTKISYSYLSDSGPIHMVSMLGQMHKVYAGLTQQQGYV